MNSAFKLARILGIQVEVHISWLLAFFLFSLTLAHNYLPLMLPDLNQATYWAAGIATTVLIFVSVLAHELAHSLVAIKEGISIKKIVLFIFGGVAQMEREPDSPLSELKISVAGPLVSLVLAVIFGTLFFLFLPPGKISGQAILFLARLNLIMAVFNLLPAFPLDGGRLLRAAIWYFNRNLLRATRFAVSLGSFFSFLLMGFGFVALLIAGSFWGIFYIFMGLMIYQAGQSSYSQLVFRQSFSGIKIREIMSQNPQTVPPDMNLQELAENFMKYKYGAFPVFYGSTTHGLVLLHRIKDVPREKWPYTSVVSIMTPLKDCLVLSPDDDAAEIMMKMAVHNQGRALVMEKDTLVGLLSRTDMMRLIQMNTILGLEE